MSTFTKGCLAACLLVLANAAMALPADFMQKMTAESRPLEDRQRDGAPTSALLAVSLLQARTALAQQRIADACRHAGVALGQARATSVVADSSASVGEALLLKAQCEQASGQS